MASPNKQASSDQANSNNSNSLPDAFNLYLKWQKIEPSQWQQLDPGIQLDIKRSVEQEFQKVIQKLKEQQRYYFVADPNTDELALFDVTAGLLWDVQYDLIADYKRSAARHRAKAISKFGLENWQVPTLQQLRALHVNSGQLLRSGHNYSFVAASEYWATEEGMVDMDFEPGLWSPAPGTGHLIACNQISVEHLVMQSLNQGWLIHSSLNSIGEKWKQALSRNRNDPYWADVIAACKQSPWQMPYLGFGQYFANLDSTSTTLPKLEQNQISDQDKGLWELHGADANLLQKFQIRPRNPALDVKDWPIAIDFGTSSTVVAYQEHGQKKLLRIGVKDHFSEPEASHFENPTVLEFVDLPKTLQPWQSTAYRPKVKWGDVRCSHEALSRLRDNEGDLSITTSVLAKIKHWALREARDIAVRISDQVNQFEKELEPLTLRNPTKGQALQVSNQDPFDPIELYAWFLGLTINWRQRGIFLKYYMTFPVAYPQVVKDKILASFRRGLQRSLPESLINQQVFNDFSVTERASEPAAFAATALPYFGIEPTEEGVAYGVFDFGGGTTDFDFGLYREPSPEEEDEGYEEVFEHFGASGDKFLGGENLLEHLAYEVFKANQALCREKKIAFTKPLDADDFPGSEMLLEKTRAAFTNTQMLMSRLRPYWEAREQNSQGIEKLNLINRSGESISCELTLPYDELESFLNQRLAKGVINFFSAMHKAFTEADVQPQKVHIFLAGNASLSPALQSLFGLNSKGEQGNKGEQNSEAGENPYHQQVAELTDRLFGALDIDFQVHAPISQSEGNPYQATTKTGVALGLLDLCPGSPVKVVNRAVIAAQGEAPFDHYVGCIKRRMFKPSLKRHAAYGQWHELGPVREGVFTLVSTQSPMANTGTVPQNDPILIHKPLSFAHAQPGERVFARAIAPDQIELTTAEHAEKLQRDNTLSVQILSLAS
ncbi:hypothetical protein [Oceanospirillum linum]|uniref:Molecular chaperone DnaK n=1 Tax=Oceanospirillum linum TaxID=966 RepID=A0A1T1HEP7_OCELI|nr:hypothetical protein [Oceanospirillum linum]OOV88331.1 hypothetical protein BTA35_0202095 [Oceanospirillum linum]SEF52525.1 hypothetical protein SAMN04489856_101430 [Oleiphilus messinensis]SMP04468.1 hypothetical protein SAMN06264348_101431 [Oceanospirillum linum]